MSSGRVSRHGVSLQTNKQSRFGEPGTQSTKSTGDNGRATQGAVGTGFGTMNKSYGGNIWGNGAFSTSAFGSSTRDNSRTRESGSLLPPRPEETQGKIGSGALVSTSESDGWGSPWTTRDNHSSSRSTSQVRAAGVSPVRQRSSNALPSTQPYRESSTFASSNLTGAVGQLPNKTTYETNVTGFKANRSTNNFTGPFPGNPAPLLDTERLRAIEANFGPWADTSAFRPPVEDRGSVLSPDHLQASGFSSRDGSLPPSRHGHEMGTMPGYGEPAQRGHSSRASFAMPRHNPSLSLQTNGGAYKDRPISQGNDLNTSFRGMSLQQYDQSVGAQKPTLSVNGGPTHFSQGSQGLGSRHQSITEFSQQIPAFNIDNLDHGRTFTPSFTPSRTSNIRGSQFRERQAQAPVGNANFASALYYSADSTPPRGYGPPGFANGDHRVMTDPDAALLHSRLRGIQQEQNYPHNISQLVAASYQVPYGQTFHYNLPPTLPGVNGVGSFMQIHPTQGMVPAIEPPKAPREHETGHGVRSALLDEFKNNQKTKRFELKDIYDHIVEFSGDQHGSRFIQTKLETANSDEKERVFREIQSNALQLMSDVFGNYVIQKFFEHGDQSQKKTLASKLKGQVYPLSTQMYACRVVQKALEHVLTDQQASIVKELEPRLMDCVKDQNGNHVIQKAIERVPAEHMYFIINTFVGKVQDLSIHAYGCRVIQRMLEHCEPHIKHAVLQEIRSCEATLIPDQYGNYVTQHAILLGSDEDRVRVFELVKGQLFAFSKHKYASNVVESVLKHSTNEQRRELMNMVSGKNERGDSHLVMLIKDAFGNYVIQSLIDTLEKSDYIAFMEILKPEIIKAKRIASGKQVQARYQLTRKIDQIEAKMHRFESNHVYGLSIPTPPSISANISATTTPPPPLTGNEQSPQSSPLPSTNSSAVDDHVQSPKGGKPTTVAQVGIAS